MALVQGSQAAYLEKHPLTVKRIPIDWTNFAETATITDSQWVDVSPVAAGVTLTNDLVTGYTTSVMVSSGTVGRTAYIENRVTFSDGRVEVITIIMPIASKVPTT